MTMLVVGGGLVGRRTAARLARERDGVVLLGRSRRPARLDGVRTTVGDPGRAAPDAQVAVLATASRDQPALAELFLRRGVHVVATADDIVSVQTLWELGRVARAHDACLVAGAAYAPGLSSLLAAWVAARFDDVFQIDTARFGTGGPACARQHHRSMNAIALEVRGGQLRRVRGGSGRRLVWFPEPVGGADCYHAGLAEPFLLHRAFPDVERIQARQSATRRDRLTAALPMLRPPHAEGLVGGLSVEVRGRIGDRIEHRVVGATGAPATGAAFTAAAMAEILSAAPWAPGVASPATVADPAAPLRQIGVGEGVRLWAYDGSTTPGEPSAIHAAKKWKVVRSGPHSLYLGPAADLSGSFA